MLVLIPDGTRTIQMPAMFDALRRGYGGTEIQTDVGLIDLQVPQLRGTEEPFRSALLTRLRKRREDLEDLIRGIYVRGASASW